MTELQGWIAISVGLLNIIGLVVAIAVVVTTLKVELREFRARNGKEHGAINKRLDNHAERLRGTEQSVVKLCARGSQKACP
jgi:hypothetical protein